VQTILALLVSLFLSNRLFARFGLLNMLVVFAFIYAGGFTSLLFFPAFSVVIVARLIKLIWANSVVDPAWNAVYNAIPIERRDQTRSFVNAVPGQAGIVLSGLLLMVGDKALTPQYLYLIGLTFSIFAILVIRKCRSAYLEALSDALRNGNSTVFVDQGESFEGFQAEAESIEVILSNLKSKDAGTRRISVEILGQIPGDRSHAALIGALKDKDVDVCIAALNSLTSFASFADLKPVTALLASPHPEIRKHAIEVLQKFGSANKQVLTAIHDHLTDEDPAVRARAVVAIALSGDKDSVEKILTQMASSRKPAVRVEAIRAIGECWSVFRENKIIKSSFAKALSDPEPAVRTEAMSGLNDSPIEFFPYFLKALGDVDAGVRKSAALAVSRFGEPVLEILCQKLNDPHLEDAALLALHEMPVKSVENTIREYVINKVQLALRDRVLANGIRSNRNIERSNLLMESIHARARRQAIFALRALDLLIENETITLAINNIEQHKQLAYAFEALETLPDTDLVRPLVRLWEHTGSTVSNDSFPWEEGLIDNDAWIRACTAFAVTSEKYTELLEKLAKSDPDELVRETAQYTLAGGTMKTLKTLPMMERILFLQKIPLFAEMSPEDLKKVASVAIEKFFPDGDYLAHKGAAGHEMYIVISGQLSVVSETGEEIAHTPPGGYAGEMAILSQEPRSASLLAKEDVRVLSIGQKEFEEILRERPDASLAVIRELCSRLRKF
jgi:HEAT repeat protein